MSYIHEVNPGCAWWIRKQESHTDKQAETRVFPYFRKLPPELRAMIWHFHFTHTFHDPGARIYAVLNWQGSHTMMDRMWSWSCRTTAPISILLAETNECFPLQDNINREARAIAKRVKPITSFNESHDFSKDLVYCVSTHQRAAIAFLKVYHWGIENLAITMNFGHYSILRSHMSWLDSLKRLYLVATPTHRITTKLPRDEYGFVEYEALKNELGDHGFEVKEPVRVKDYISDFLNLCPKNVVAKVVVDVDAHRSTEWFGQYELYRRSLR